MLIYPAVSDFVNRLSGTYAIQSLQNQTARTDPDDLQSEYSRALDYNYRLLHRPSEITDTEYLQILDFQDGMMGYITIEKINVMLPIYHGVSETVLSKGVGHLPSSGLPVGGRGNHAVLTGHTGLPSADLFTELTELEVGDVFYITVLGEVLTYKIDQIKVVLPEQTQDLMPVAGADLCTLITCTPYGINSHRLLVRGRRAPMHQPSESILPTQKENPPLGMIWCTVILLCGYIATIILLLFQKIRY